MFEFRLCGFAVVCLFSRLFWKVTGACVFSEFTAVGSPFASMRLGSNLSVLDGESDALPPRHVRRCDGVRARGATLTPPPQKVTRVEEQGRKIEGYQEKRSSLGARPVYSNHLDDELDSDQ